MRRRRQAPVAAAAPFVPVEGTVQEKWDAWLRWEAALRSSALSEEQIEAVLDASLPVMPDAPFDPDSI